MIPVYEPYLKGNEEKYVIDCLKKNWLSSSGEYNSKLEDSFAAYCGVKYGISVTSGTAALHIAIASLKIGKGDEVIVPANDGEYTRGTENGADAQIPEVAKTKAEIDRG